MPWNIPMLSLPGMITRLDSYVGEVLRKPEEKVVLMIIVSLSLAVITALTRRGWSGSRIFGRDGKLRGLKRQCHEGWYTNPLYCALARACISRNGQ